MTTVYTKESSISREHARKILASIGESIENYGDSLTDWYLCWDADGGEYLHRGGDDEPTAQNDGTLSWVSMGSF